MNTLFIFYTSECVLLPGVSWSSPLPRMPATRGIALRAIVSANPRPPPPPPPGLPSVVETTGHHSVASLG